MAGDLACDARRVARRVEAERVEPDGGEAGADGLVAQVGEADAVRTRIGEGHIGGATARELGVQLDHVADIDHHQEGRPALVGGQGAGVVLGLAAGAQQGVVEDAAEALAHPGLLGFEDEAGAPVTVDVAVGTGAVAVAEIDAALEDIGVARGCGHRRLGLGQAEQFAQLGDEKLVVGTLRPAGRLPAGDEGFDGIGVHGVGRVAAPAQRGSACGRQGAAPRCAPSPFQPYLRQTVVGGAFGQTQVVVCLQSHPEFRAGAEVAC